MRNTNDSLFIIHFSLQLLNRKLQIRIINESKSRILNQMQTQACHISTIKKLAN